MLWRDRAVLRSRHPRRDRRLLQACRSPSSGTGGPASGGPRRAPTARPFWACGTRSTPHEDRAAAFEKVQLESRVAMEPRPYQKEALGAWRRAGSARASLSCRPARARRPWPLARWSASGGARSSSCPTLALLKQWYSVLCRTPSVARSTIGLLGGGYHEITPLTVTTYDSAYIHAERYGDRFALVVYDEVHHLPAPKNAIIPKMLLAPYSLGLTATPGASGRRPRTPSGARGDRSSTGARPRIWREPTWPPSSWCAYPSS